MTVDRGRCPICGKSADPKQVWFPFCNERCRTQDLANWSTGAYSIAAPASEADEHIDPSSAPPGGATDD